MTTLTAERQAIADELVRCCRSLWGAGLIAGSEGNVSARLGDDRVLITPRGLLKAELSPEDMVVVDLAGERRNGYRDASTELDLHLRAYRRRKDCGAVVHAHPPAATGFAVAGEGLPRDVLPEIALLLGEVPCVPYARSGSPALGDTAEPYFDRHCVVLLANHGAVAWGATLSEARIRMESLEQTARILLVARLLGRMNRLTPDQIAALEQMRGSSAHD